jgi:hypothetical protein
VRLTFSSVARYTWEVRIGAAQARGTITLTIELPTEIESRLRDEAARQGIDIADFVARMVKANLGESSNGAKHLSHEETELLERINSAFSPETVQRCRELVARRQAEILTPAEHQELIQLSDGIELANAARVGDVIELARLRGVPVDTLVRQLGVPLPVVGVNE